MRPTRRFSILVAVAAMAIGIAIPVAVWAGEQTFDDVPPTDPAFDAIEWLAATGITNGCQAEPPLYCPDDAVTRRQQALFTQRSAYMLIPTVSVAEDAGGWTMGIGPVTLAEGDIDVNSSATLSVTGQLTAEFAFGDGPAPGVGGGSITDVIIWVQINNSSCAAAGRVAAMTLAEEGTEPLLNSATIVEGEAVPAGTHTITLCGETIGGFDAFVWSAGFTAIASPDAMSDLVDDDGVPTTPNRG